jgi:hypothetical protein
VNVQNKFSLSQTNYSDEVRFIIYSHLSFDLSQNEPRNMNVLTKARGVELFCVKEALLCGLTPIYVPSVSTASEHGFNF